MATLITGGAGFIGSHLATLLSGMVSSTIVCVDNFNDYYDPKLKRANAERISSLPWVEVVEADFCDACDVSAAVQFVRDFAAAAEKLPSSTTSWKTWASSAG